MIINPIPMGEVWMWRERALPELKRVEGWLGGIMSAEHLLDFCEQDRMLLWVIHDLEDEEPVAYLVTQINEYPLARVILLVAIAGRGMSRWIRPASVVLRDYASKMGCTRWQIWARTGWLRVLRAWKPSQRLVLLDGDV